MKRRPAPLPRLMICETYLLKTVILCFLFLVLLVGKSALAQTDLITNGSFETTGAGFNWFVLTNGVNQTDSWWNINNPAGAHPPGSRYEYLGAQQDGISAANNVDGLIYQQVTIPAGTSSAILSFYLRITTSESPSAASDRLYVEIRNSSGTVLATPLSYSNQNSSQFSSWTQQTVNLSSYAGQTIRIAFHGVTNSNTITVFRIDDVSVRYTSPPPPQIAVGPPTLDFGSIQVGSCSPSFVAIQHVNGTGPASGSVAVSPNPPFSLTGAGTFLVSNGSGANIGVQFCPSSAGPFSGSAVVSSPGSTFTGSNTVALTGTGTNPVPTLGVITVKATYNGQPWSGTLNYSLNGPVAFNGNNVPTDFQNRTAGIYTIAYTSGGPTGATLSNITPSSTQTLTGGGVITFTLNFTTSPPTATTAACQVNGPSDVFLAGVVNPNGSPTDAWFEWGTTTGYGNETPHKDIGSGTSTVQVGYQLPGLSPNTYHCRMVGRNSGGTSFGDDQTFTISVATQTPTVATGIVINSAPTFVTLSGMITPNGAPYDAWFEWGLTQALGNKTDTLHSGNGTQIIEFTDFLKNLTTGSTYYYRVVAQNTKGTSNGLVKSFIHGVGIPFGTQTQSGHSPDPVNTATGNYTYSKKDLEIPGKGLSFQFIRAYNSGDLVIRSNSSHDAKPGPLGFTWTHNFNVTLSAPDDLDVILRWGDGRTEIYYANGSGGFTPQPGVFDTLIKNGDGTYTLKKKDLTLYDFDSSKRLSSVVDKNGNTISLTYTGDNLTQVTDTAGRNIAFTYDASNRIIQINDPVGRVLRFGYDGNGDLISATDLNGKTTSYGYDPNHLLLEIIDPRGNKLVRNTYDSTTGKVTEQRDAKGGLTRFTYNVDNTSFVDALNNTTIHYYGAFYRLIKETDGRGNSILYEYDSAGNRISVTDKNGNKTSYTYDAKGNVLTKIDPRLNGTTITYDTNNNPLTRTDAAGQTTFTYDSNGNLIKTKDPLTNTTEYGYDANGLLISIKDRRGNPTTNTYDPQGNLVRVTDALSKTTDYTYDGVGRRLSTKDARGNTTRFTYDANGNVLSIRDALDGVTSFIYDENNNRIAMIDPLTNRTDYTYDVKDLLIKTLDPLGADETITYDALDRKIAVKDKNGKTTNYSYDEMGNLKRVIDPLTNVSEYTYDANGNRKSAKDPNGNVSNYTYDELNRLISESDPLTHITRKSYDALGRVISSVNAENQETKFDYDPLGRLIKVTDAKGGTVFYSYDANGNRLSIKDPNGNTTQFIYDVLNRVIKKTEALPTSTNYGYDAVGNRISVTDAKGNLVNYTYDPLNRLVGITYPDKTSVNFTYDANGNRIQMVDSLGTSRYQYDALNRMTSYTNPFNKTVGYGYDPTGNRTSLTYPDTKSVTYTYDPLNRLASVKDWLNRTTTYSYDNAGRLTSTLNSNGTSAAYSYDTANRLVGLTNAKSNATTISSYSFTLDAIGNHSQTTVNEPLLPNFTSKSTSYTYDAENRLTTVDSVANSFDLNGNMTAKGSNLFSFDFNDRLVQTTIGGTTTQYSYDGVGNRLAKITGGTPTRYVLDINRKLANVLAETDGSGTATAYYVYGLGLISKVLPDGTAIYYHYDSRGSTVALTDASQTITDAYAYDPFGKAANSSGTTANPFKYVGRYGVVDEGNNLSYIRARYYESNLGRFVSKDPLTGQDNDGQSLNRYVYALNSPMVLIDPSGLFSWSTLGASEIEFAKTAGQFGLGVGGLIVSGVEFVGGHYVGSATSYVGALQDLNDSSKSISAAFLNVVNAVRGAPPVTGNNFEGQGILDAYLNTTAGKLITTGSDIISALATAKDIINIIPDLVHSGQSILSASRHLNDLRNFAQLSILTNSASILDNLRSLYDLGIISLEQLTEIVKSGRLINEAQAPVIDIVMDVQSRGPVFKK